MTLVEIANPFSRTRRDHASETTEDYVEAISQIIGSGSKCRCRDLAKVFGVTHVTVHRTVARLDREGFVTTKPYGPVELTAKGKRLAKQVRHRHEVVYQFLMAIGVSDEVAKADAEGIEHHVSEQTLHAFEEQIKLKMNQKHS